MFDPFFDAFASVLNFFFVITGQSYGGAIILLTLSVMIILTPLTLKGTRSMMRMQRLQPEMKRLQKEYKDDRQKLNEELMKFYKENNINPLGGCLPLLAQMPVFLVLFQTLRGLSGSVTTEGCLNGATECFDPKHLSASQELYTALRSTDQMLWLGIDLSKSASTALSESFVTALPYLFMILLVLISSYVQQKQVSGRSTGGEVNQQQQMLLKIMPAFMAFISFTLQGALVLYFVVSNFWRVGQQWFIGRHIYGKDEDGNPIEVTARDTTPEEDKPKGFALTRLLGEQAGAARSAREDAKAAKEAKAAKDTKETGAKAKGSTNGRGSQGTSRTNNRPTSAAKGAKSGGTPSGSSLPQPRPRKKKKR